MEALQQEYYQLLSQQEFDEDALDYSILENHKNNLRLLAEMGQSGITVFDMCKKEHVFASYNMKTLFGYNMDGMEVSDMELFNSKIHPDDFIQLFRGGIDLLRFMLSLSDNEKKAQKTDFKLISEFRILNAQNKYIRVVEQQRVLELDAKGNVWLALGVMDISPNQDNSVGIKQTLINVKSAEVFQAGRLKEAEVQLTKRESEVLKLVGAGLLSKEISDKLSISVHTVNTHRQRILEKLDADNSMEAVRYASAIGLLN